MGISCSINEEESQQAAGKGPGGGPRPRQTSQTLVKTIPPVIPPQRRDTGTLSDPDGSNNINNNSKSKSKSSKMTRVKHQHQHQQQCDDPHEWDTVDSLDRTIDHKLAATGDSSSSSSGSGGGGEAESYQQRREELRRREAALGFEYRSARAGTAREHRADRILQALRRRDDEAVYGAAAPRREEGGGDGGDGDGEGHARFAGDHFLSNRGLIDRTGVFGLARRAPKGAHLHIHFNACLRPGVLLEVARGMEHMYITSDVSLAGGGGEGEGDGDGERRRADRLRRCRIQFSIMALGASRGSLFDAGYSGRAPMRFAEFLEEFPRQHPGEGGAMAWLQRKLVFREEEAHGLLQTAGGAWEAFNARTQMMKGLFNYETAFRTYTRRCLEDFVADNIQYAEIRPNFMDTNQVWTDDGLRKIDNAGIMEMIMDEYGRFQAETDGYFGGLKVIYCCPRSWPNDKVAAGLRECLAFKRRWPGWVAGFDLVGEEGKGRALGAFAPELLRFQDECGRAGVEVPFLFHCGETAGAGSEADGNLLDALLLRSRRIGHGFALARHPYVMERMKRDGVCLEVCPISNEVLGLTPRASGHSVYNLLANNVHCTVSSDNGTLFK